MVCQQHSGLPKFFKLLDEDVAPEKAFERAGNPTTFKNAMRAYKKFKGSKEKAGSARIPASTPSSGKSSRQSSKTPKPPKVTPKQPPSTAKKTNKTSRRPVGEGRWPARRRRRFAPRSPPHDIPCT